MNKLIFLVTLLFSTTPVFPFCEQVSVDNEAIPPEGCLINTFAGNVKSLIITQHFPLNRPGLSVCLCMPHLEQFPSVAKDNITLSMPPVPKDLVIEKKQRKDDIGFGLAGLTGFIYNRNISMNPGFGGAFGGTLGSRGIIEGSLVYYVGNFKNTKGLDVSSKIEWYEFDIYGDLYLTPDNIFFKPYIQFGYSRPYIWIINEESDQEYAGNGMLLGAGIDIWIGRFLSVFTEGCFRYTWLEETWNWGEDLSWAFEKNFGLTGGIRLVIPVKNDK